MYICELFFFTQKLVSYKWLFRLILYFICSKEYSAASKQHTRILILLSFNICSHVKNVYTYDLELKSKAVLKLNCSVHVIIWLLLYVKNTKNIASYKKYNLANNMVFIVAYNEHTANTIAVLVLGKKNYISPYHKKASNHQIYHLIAEAALTQVATIHITTTAGGPCWRCWCRPTCVHTRRQ